MRSMIVKMILFGLMLFSVKSPVLAQDPDIKCEISGLDLNLSGKPGYGIDFGSFSLFADGEKDEEGVVMLARHYKLPQTKLILSVLVASVPKNELFGDLLMVEMVLGKKRVPFSSDSYDKFLDEITKHAVGHVRVGYPMEGFTKERKGLLFMSYLGKKKPIQIAMTCKKEGS